MCISSHVNTRCLAVIYSNVQMPSIHQEQIWDRHENVRWTTISEPLRFPKHELLPHTITTNVSVDARTSGMMMCVINPRQSNSIHQTY